MEIRPPDLKLLRPLPVLLALGCGVHLLASRPIPGAPNRSAALAKALGEQNGLSATADDVAWVDPVGESDGRALVRAQKGKEAAALYLVRTRQSPEGVLLDYNEPRRLTKSRGVEESRALVHGNYAAAALLADGAAISVQLFDLTKEEPPSGPGWTFVKRLQNSLTNLQETGQLAGIGRRSFRLLPPSKALALQFKDGGLVLQNAGKLAKVAAGGTAAPKAAPLPGWVKEETHTKGQMGNVVTWAVDRVRNMPWFGDTNMQRLKAVAFSALDVVTRAKRSVGKDTTAEEIAKDLGDLGTPAGKASYTDPARGWPPPPMKPFFKTPLPSEGKWILRNNDPFISHPEGSDPPFVTGYVRTDRNRTYTRIYVTMWDPRFIELHPVAGTVEPKGPTGDAGPGVIPRKPKVMGRVVAAMNGGFQALHGEWGMMADDVVYLPPKPYAATVAHLRDGSTGFGVWPKTMAIPRFITGYRQNLTPLVMNEKLNPYGRSWWGGTPPGWEDRIHTTRSGLCLTKEGYVAYFYGNEIDAMVLGQAMIQARCKLGMHMDMNPGHTGLEFYNVAPKSQLKPLGRPMQRDWERGGDLEDMEGWSFRSRRMVRGMGLMNFPRYIQHESRDFFYLTLRHTLPGAGIKPPHAKAEAGEGAWRTKGLPQHGYPHAQATSWLRPLGKNPAAKVRLLKLDPHTVRVAGSPGVDPKAAVVTVFQNSPAAVVGDTALWLGASGFFIGPKGPAGSVPVFAGKLAKTPPAGAQAAVGIDETGMLVYVALEEGAPTSALSAALDLAHCTSRLWLMKKRQPLLGGTNSLAGTPGRKLGTPTSTLVRVAAPGARSIFKDTPILPREVWKPLQRKRIRYFKKYKKD